MSTILDLAIAISVADFASSTVRNIIGQFNLLQGASQETLAQMNRFRNLAWGGGIAAAIGTAGILAVSSATQEAVTRAGNLQEIMTEIKAQGFGKDLFDPSKADEISKKMKEIEDLTTRLGLETTFSNLDAGNVIRELQKGAVDYKDIVNGAAEATIKFAQLNKMAPEAAAELMVQTRAGFQLTGQQMLEAADTVTKVAAASSAHSEDINRGLGNMAGVATQMWGTRGKYEQVLDSSALVALTRTQTAEGSSAGTFVRNFLERLVPQTKRQTDAMEEMGWLDAKGRSVFLDYSKDPRGQLKSALDIARIIRETVGGETLIADGKEVERQFELAKEGMGTDKLIKYFHKIFGEQGGRTAYTLLRTGTGSIEEIMGKVGDQLSLTERVRLQMENYKQVVDTAKEAWNTFLTVLGSPLLKTATAFFDNLGDKLGVAALYFQEHPQVSKYMFAIAGGISIFLAVGGTIVVVAASLGALNIALTHVGLSLSIVAAKSLGFLLVATAVAGIAYLIYRNWDTLKQLLVDYGGVIKLVAGIFFIAYAPAITVATLQMWRLATVTTVNTIRTLAMNAVTRAGAFIMGAYRSAMLLVTAAHWLWTAATSGTLISTLLLHAETLVLSSVLAIARGAVMAWTAAQWLLNTALTANPIGVVIVLIGLLVGVVVLATVKWDEWWKKIKSFGDNIPGWVVFAITAFMPVIGIPLLVIKYWDKAANAVKNFLGIKSVAEKDPVRVSTDPTGIMEQLKSATAKGIDIPANLNTDQLNQQIATVQKGMNTGGGIATMELAKGLVAPEGMTSVTNSAESLNTAITTKLPKPDEMNTFGKNLGQGLADGLKSKEGAVRAASQNLASAIHANLGVQSPTKEGPLSTNHLWGGNLMKSIAGGMLGNLTVVKQAASLAADAMTVKSGYGVRSGGIAVNNPGSSRLVVQGPLIGAVYQQPGEDTEALVYRIKREIAFEREQGKLKYTPVASFQGVMK